MVKIPAGGFQMNDKIKEQILVIRNIGITNMFDVTAVQRIAFEMDFYELVDFLKPIERLMLISLFMGNKLHLSPNLTCYYVLLE